MPNTTVPGARLRVRLLAAGAVAALNAACGGDAGRSRAPATAPPTPAPAATAITVVAGDPVATGYADASGAAARFDRPGGLAVDAAGNVYVADYFNAVIRRIAPDGRVITWAGVKDGAATTDGPRATARFTRPYAMGTDPAGNLYVTDGLAIRRITLAGDVATVHTVQLGNSIDGRSTGRFLPTGVAADAAGNLYVTTPIGTRRVSPVGFVTMLEGVATQDNVFGTQLLQPPRPVAVDSNGNVWVVTMAGQLARVNAAGTGLAVVAGAPNAFGYADGKGTAARFAQITALAPDRSGNVFAADLYNNVIRKITADGTVSTVAGTRDTHPYPTTLPRPAADLPALQTGPLPGNFAPLEGGLAADGKGNLYAISGNAVVKIALP